MARLADIDVALPEPQQQGPRWLELAAIAGILAIVAALEVRFGAFSTIATRLTLHSPGAPILLTTLAASAWIALAVYSLRRRWELKAALQAHARLRADVEMARIIDAATGLPNRLGLSAVLDTLAAQTPQGIQIAVIGVSFSNLKMITDLQGPAMAGEVARTVADSLAASEWNFSLVSSDNGQVFYVVLHLPLDEAAEQLASAVEDIRDRFRSIDMANGLRLPVSVQIGTLCFEPTAAASLGLTGEEVLRRIDLALHDARKRGSGAVVAFDEGIEKTLDTRAIIEGSMIDAIESGEIEPYFQPLIDIVSNGISGFEILARWNHPTLGQVSPSVFIPVAEECGHLETLTLTLLDRALISAKGWDGNFKLALNVSPNSMKNKLFIERLLAIVDLHGFDRRRLEVEITETAFMEDSGNITDSIDVLKNNGISISIDDFGTGYAGLQSLHKFPFDKIKIDQSFVKNIPSDPESRKIVQAIIELSRSMGLTTVAEGVEGTAARDVLGALGCDVGQGYLFSKAMPLGSVAGFIRAHDAAQEAQAAPEPVVKSA